ncbi:MAG: ABC transporter permease [Cyanobacteria bacterium J06639_1]
MAASSNSLRTFILTRLLLAPLQLWVVVTLIFALLRIVPGDPIAVILGPRATPAVMEQMRQTLGMDGSILQQYWRYLFDLLRLDLGSSISTAGKSVWDIIYTFFPSTVELAVSGLLVSLAIGFPLGILAATRPQSSLDRATRSFSILTYALPMFWLGMMLQLIFSVQLRWFPVGSRLPVGVAPPKFFTGAYSVDALLSGNWDVFWASLHHLALPAFTLGLVMSGVFARMIRVNLREVLDATYITAARSRGFGEWRIVLIHALRNALVPILTVIGLALASLLGGALLTEVTFSWPGLASRLVQAIGQRDYPVVQGLVVFFAAIVVVVSLGLDILNAYIDPRIRY